MSPFYPSLIAADLLNLKKEVQLLDPHIPGYHLDVMDFHFVPNLTMGPDFINALRKITNKPFLVHLMVEYPEKYLERLILNKGDIVSVHPEARSTLPMKELFRQILHKGWTPSIALNPETPVSVIKELGIEPEHVLLMSVNPGFSGQAFMPIVYDKLKELREGPIIAIDGGVSLANAKPLLNAGANQLVVGSALFKEGDPLKELQRLQDSLMIGTL
jgi:ribulose-phosphate 3-epimerase